MDTNARKMHTEKVSLTAGVEASFKPAYAPVFIEFASRNRQEFRLTTESGGTADGGAYKTVDASSPGWYIGHGGMQLDQTFYLQNKSYNDTIEVIYTHKGA